MSGGLKALGWLLVVLLLAAAGWQAKRALTRKGQPTERVAETTSMAASVPASPTSLSITIRDRSYQATASAALVLPSLAPLSSLISSPSSSQPSVGVISISDVGFKPAALTVKSGDNVLFINDGQANHWPVVEGLKVGSPEAALPTGERWSVKIEAAGVYSIKDQLFPSFSGQLVVK